MPDTVLNVTEGSGKAVSVLEVTNFNGTSVAAREIQHTEVVTRSTTSAAAAVSVTNPFPVAQQGTATVAVDDSVPIQIRAGSSNVLRPVITGSLTAYSIGDVVGGEIAVVNAARQVSWGLSLDSLSVFSDDNLTPTLDFMFFDADLVGGTYTDNGALTLSTADKATWLARVRVATGDWQTAIGGDSFATVTPRVRLRPNGTQDLRMLVIAQSAFTLTATTNLRCALGVAQD